MNQSRPPMPSVPAHYPMPGPPPPNVPDPRQRIARFKTITRRAIGHWPIAMLILLVGGAISFYFAQNAKREYRSEAVILFKPGMSQNRDEEPASEKAVRIAPKLKEMLITRQRLEPLITENKLYPRIVDSRGMLEAVEEMRAHIGFRGRDSETFVVAFDADTAAADAAPTKTPEIVQHVTEKLAQTVIDEFMRGNVSASTKQLEFLQAEMKRSEDDLEKANHALAVFLAAHPEFASAANQLGQAGALAIPQQAFSAAGASHVDGQLASLVAQKRRVEQEAAQAAGQPAGPVTPPAVLAKIEGAKKAKEEAYGRLAQAQADFADKKSKYTEQHPDYLSAKAALAQAQAQAAQADKDLAAANAEVPAAPTVSPASMSPELRARLDSINAQIAARSAELRKMAANPTAAAAVNPSIVELEAEWQRLLRAVREAKSGHEDLKAKFDKAKLQQSAVAGAASDSLEILEHAFLPTRPSKGSKTRVMMMGMAVATLLAMLYAYGRVLFSDTLIDAGDIEAQQVIPVLGVMPKIASNPNPPQQQTAGAGAPGKEGVPGGV